MKTKRKKILLPLAVFVVLVGVALMSCSTGDPVMKKSKGVYTIDTTTLTSNIKGFNGPTPLIITISGDKVQSVEALENAETPRFFERLKENGLLESWNGMAVDEVLNTQVDVVSGCTFSSNAVIANVHEGVKYYKEHQK